MCVCMSVELITGHLNTNSSIPTANNIFYGKLEIPVFFLIRFR